MFRLTTLLFILTLTLTACNTEEERPPSPVEGRELEYTATVQFLNEAGEVVSEIDAAVADDDDSRSEGLMDVHNLPADSGMIFKFEDEQPRSFWMANTPISLDIIYANSDFEIVRIHRNTPPYSHENIHSEEPAMYVVEVNAGYTLRHDITEGMSIRVTD
ncbi:MAG: DUF192 domain-containing protein [Balneolaceae bacterium]|nr:MAG: DUF192 domain-containing protein [Balneolaceae bacterium]